MMKELERVRAERDSLRAKVGSSGGRDKALKGSVSSSTMSASSSSSTGKSIASGAVGDRPPAVRHHSDDIGESHLAF